MNLQRESYLQAYQRQEQLAGIENQWQIEELLRSQRQSSILGKAKTWLHCFTQAGRLGSNPPVETN